MLSSDYETNSRATNYSTVWHGPPKKFRAEDAIQQLLFSFVRYHKTFWQFTINTCECGDKQTHGGVLMSSITAGVTVGRVRVWRPGQNGGWVYVHLNDSPIRRMHEINWCTSCWCTVLAVGDSVYSEVLKSKNALNGLKRHGRNVWYGMKTFYCRSILSIIVVRLACRLRG